MSYNHVMKSLWKHPHWPKFKYDHEKYDDRNTEFRIKSERLIGTVEALPVKYQQDTVIDLMLSEAIKTSEIEGEMLDRASVRSSLLALITSESKMLSPNQKASGAASLLVDVRKNWSLPLTHDILGQWQTMAVPEHLSSLIMRGLYRTDSSPMQIVSGHYGHHKIHYEAPPSLQVQAEMEKLLNWYNNSNPLISVPVIPEIVRAGIAHLWFEKIHPFDDGNGRVGRAIADHALSQYLGYPTTACLSTAIEQNKKKYYYELEQAGHNDLNIDNWLDYFSETVISAQNLAKEEVDFVLKKTRFYDTFIAQLNERQTKLVSRIFDEGRKGFEGGISTKKYEIITKCSNRTASRDLADLLKKGIIKECSGGGRSTRYELVTIKSNSILF
ncbi:MAG: Fic family protein [Thiohalomonadales bacterium]